MAFIIAWMGQINNSNAIKSSMRSKVWSRKVQRHWWHYR